MRGRSDVVEKMFPRKKSDILASCIAFQLRCLEGLLAPPLSPNVKGEKSSYE